MNTNNDQHVRRKRSTEYQKAQIQAIYKNNLPILDSLKQSTETNIKNIIEKNKRSLNIENVERLPRAITQGVDLYVEVLLVTDCSVYFDHQIFANSTNQDIIFSHMRIYLSHLFYAV